MIDNTKVPKTFGCEKPIELLIVPIFSIFNKNCC